MMSMCIQGEAQGERILSCRSSLVIRGSCAGRRAVEVYVKTCSCEGTRKQNRQRLGELFGLGGSMARSALDQPASLSILPCHWFDTTRCTKVFA